MYTGYLLPISVQGHFEVIQCTCLKMACKSKAAGHKAKQSEIWGVVCSRNICIGYL